MGRDAYEDGYKDGETGVERRPPKSIPSANFGGGADSGASQPASSSSGFGGVGSIVKYGGVAYTVYNLGKTPGAPGGWTPQAAMVNAKANPLQVVMIAVM